MKKVLMLLAILSFAIGLAAQSVWTGNSAGGKLADKGNAIVTDQDCKSYVIGNFKDGMTIDDESLTSYGSTDIFIACIDNLGNWIWVKSAGSIGSDNGIDITNDAEGNLYITGYFSNTAHFGDFTLTSDGHQDIFVAKLDFNGNWIWVRRAGGDYSDGSYAIDADDYGNIVLTGYVKEESNFGDLIVPADGKDVFVARISSDGSWLWVNNAITTNDSNSQGICTSGEKIYITGYFSETAWMGSDSLISTGQKDIFVAQLDIIHGRWIWAKSVGSTGADKSRDICVDNMGKVNITGYYCNDISFDSYDLFSHGPINFFIAQLDNNQNWRWAKGVSNGVGVLGMATCVDNNCNIYITGQVRHHALFGEDRLTTNRWDVFVAKLDMNGNWIWAVNPESSSYEYGNGISVYKNDHVYITGSFTHSIEIDESTLFTNGSHDIFVLYLKKDTRNDLEIVRTFWNENDTGWCDWHFNVGEAVELEVTIKNNGDTTQTDPFYVDLYYDLSGLPGFLCFGDQALWIEEDIEPGETIRVYFEDVSSSVAEIWTSYVQVDADNFIDEYNEDNNAYGPDFIYWEAAKSQNDLSDAMQVPESTEFYGNYPNPFNPETTIRFGISEDTSVNIEIFNIKGQLIKTLVNENLVAGFHDIIWDGKDNSLKKVPSGIYFSRMKTADYTKINKMILMK